MIKGDYLSSVLRSPKTVFSTEDIALLWHEATSTATKVRLNYYVASGDLIRIRRGLYAKDKNYNKLELATRILIPSYVSFETVLAREGLIFQFYTSIFVASYANRELTVDTQSYIFRRIKAEILLDSNGVKHVEHTSIATRERAFLDMLYLNDDYYFDNLRSLDWGLIHTILPVYKNQRLVRAINRIYKKEQNL